MMEDFNEPIFTRHKTRLQKQMESYEQAEREGQNEQHADNYHTGDRKNFL